MGDLLERQAAPQVRDNDLALLNGQGVQRAGGGGNVQGRGLGSGKPGRRPICGSGLVAPGTGIMLHNRGGLFTLDEKHPNVLAPRKRPLHTIIPAFMQKGDVRIGFGIMGGFNQAQAHAQFVADIADFGLDIQQALEAGRFTKGSFAGCDVQIEALVPDKVRSELKALGHDVRVVPPRSGTFGYGQAVMSDGAGVHFGASEPRHDGAAIPEAPPIFGRAR